MRRSSSRRRALRKVAELSLAAPQVVALRTLGVLAAGGKPTARERREQWRMGAEKVAAFSRATDAVGAQWLRFAAELPLVLLRYSFDAWLIAWTIPFGRAHRSDALQRRWRATVMRAFDSGLAPVHRTALGNLRRLTRRTPR